MSANVERIDTVVVGAGQSGLAISYLLTERGRDHVVLDKAERIGSSWHGRWDSFTLVTPNWGLRLPGHPYPGDDPDGFLTRDEVISYLEDYASGFGPPLRLGVTVTRVEPIRDRDGYRVHTSDGVYEAVNVVVAAGTFQRPRIPDLARHLSPDLAQIHTSEYRNPGGLPAGGVLVVGSGQSGCQIAQELHEAGRRTHLCVGSAGRFPRRYRRHDGLWWAVQLGLTDQTVEQLDSPAGRFRANPQISGKDGGRDINLHQFARDGITLLGRLQDGKGTRLSLAPDLHESLAAADTMAAEFRGGVDEYVQKTGMDAPVEQVDEPEDGYDQEILTELDLADTGIRSVLWATGYRWDYSWIDAPIFDDFGYPIQRQGVTDYPGLYFLGLHFLHTLKSGLFLGVGSDAAHIAQHIEQR